MSVIAFILRSTGLHEADSQMLETRVDREKKRMKNGERNGSVTVLKREPTSLPCSSSSFTGHPLALVEPVTCGSTAAVKGRLLRIGPSCLAEGVVGL